MFNFRKAGTCNESDDLWTKAGYRIINRIGSGGQGTIFLAQQTTAERAKVAIKVWNDGSNHKAFQREVFNLRNVNHPNIVRYLDCLSFPNNDCALVMEYIGGKPLDEMLKARKCIEWEDASGCPAKHILRGLLQGLSALHLMCPPLIHRDVKPSNIMIASEGHRVLLVDFGLSKRQSSGQTLTESLQNVCGTPAYLSPEAVMGLDDLDERIDVWAAGVVLYEMLAGSPLFRAPNLFALGQQIGTYDFVPLSEAPSDVNEILLRRMLAVDRTTRLFNAPECLSALALVGRRNGGSSEPDMLQAKVNRSAVPSALSRCLRLLLVDLPPVLRKLYLDNWRQAEGRSWVDGPSAGSARLARDGACVREWPAWMRAAITRGDSSAWDLVVLGELLLRSEVNPLPPNGADRADLSRLLDCNAVLAVATDATWAVAGDAGGALHAELRACEESALRLLARNTTPAVRRPVPATSQAEVIKVEGAIRELQELNRRLLRLPAGPNHTEEGLALLDDLCQRRRMLQPEGSLDGWDGYKDGAAIGFEEEDGLGVDRLRLQGEDSKPESAGDADVSQSLLNRAPRRNPGHSDSTGTCGSGSGNSSSREKTEGERQIGSPLLRGSPRCSGPAPMVTGTAVAAPEHELDPLLLRPPRIRPTPPPPPRGNGLRRGSGSSLQRSAAVSGMGGAAASSAGTPACSPQLGVVGVRQELVQGRAILFGVVGLRTGTVIGERGSGPGQFRTPAGVAVDTEGRILVADSGNHRIQVFSADGRPAGCFGSEGSGPGKFRGPCGVAVDFSGRVLVVDGGNHRVQIFSRDGGYLNSFGSFGSANGELKEPRGIAVDPSPSGGGSIYVADWGNSRVQAFDGNCRFVRCIGASPMSSAEEEPSHSTSADGRLKSPYGVGFGSDGSVLVADTANHRIQVFSADGRWERSFGAFGAELGQLKYPNAVASDASGRIVVSDNWNHRLQVFDSDGQPLRCVGSKGAGLGQLSYPTGLALDREGRIIVSDTANHRVQVF